MLIENKDWTEVKGTQGGRSAHSPVRLRGAGHGDAVGRGLTRLNSSRRVEGRDASCSLPPAETEYYKFAR